jgi:hypothetical protein
MANSAIALSYSGQGFANSGEVLASQVSGDASRAIDAFGTSTTDNSAATITVNYIDGTKALSFTPSAVQASISAATGSVVPQAFKVDSISTTGFVVTGAANWPAGTVKFAFRIVK